MTAFDGKHAMKMVLYKDHVKLILSFIRFQNLLKKSRGKTSRRLGCGYRVLVDKDGLQKI
jgi:aminoglycoside 6-adenylyltransferase